MRREIENLLAPASADAVWAAFVAAMRDLGYPHVFYTARRFADMTRLWLAEELEWRSTFPTAFLDQLHVIPPLTESPWGMWSGECGGSVPCDWFASSDAAAYVTPDGQRLMNLMMQHGVLIGHAVSLLGLSVRVTGAVLVSTGAGTSQQQANVLWQRVGADVVALSGVYHLRSCALPRSIARQKLTQRQREVMEWAAYGKTIAEIAEILGVGPTTVEKHLRLAREALDASTTAQAILKAHQRNQIFIQPVETGERG